MSMDSGKSEPAQQEWKSSGGGSGASSGGAKCPKCDKSVYEAEKIVGAGLVSILEYGQVYAVNLSIS